MSTIKKLSIVIIAFLVISSLLTPFVSSETVLGDSEFPAKNGDTFIWRCVNSTGERFNEGDLTKFTVEYVYNDTYSSIDALFVNSSLSFYDVIKGLWIPSWYNLFYMAYNFSQNFLNCSEISYFYGNVFIVPIPVNLTLVGDAIEGAGVLNYSTDVDKLILDYQNNTMIEMTIGSNGITSLIEEITNGTTRFKWEFHTDEYVVIIPYGNYFLIALIISIVSVIFIIKKKINLD